MQHILFSLAAMATAVTANMGQAVVINNCDYHVTLCNTPAFGAGFTQIDKDLAPGDTYKQTWTNLPGVSGGWSIKLSKTASLSNILQYEYTCLDDGIIWYDLSEVNGNPWSKDWDISAPQGSGCNPKQTAYQFWNDDAHGMQASCPQETDITLTLCNSTGSAGAGSSQSSPSPAPASQPAPAPQASSSAPAPAAPAPAAPAPATSAAAAPAPAYNAPAPAQQTDSASFPLRFPAGSDAGKALDAEAYEATVTQLETAYATQYVTADAPATAAHYRRHAHHHARRHIH